MAERGEKAKSRGTFLLLVFVAGSDIAREGGGSVIYTHTIAEILHILKDDIQGETGQGGP